MSMPIQKMTEAELLAAMAELPENESLVWIEFCMPASTARPGRRRPGRRARPSRRRPGQIDDGQVDEHGQADGGQADEHHNHRERKVS